VTEPGPTRRPGVGETLGAAAKLMRDFPRETMLPLLAIQAPLVLGTIFLTVLLYSTAFSDEIYPRGGLTSASEDSTQVFVLILVVAVGAVLGLVGQGATIVSVAAIALGNRLTLSEALDPAFTRLGGLLLLTLIFAIAGGLLAFTIVGLAVLPFLVARFGVAYQVFLLEKVSPIEALKKSWSMMHGNMLRLIGIILVGFLLILLIGALVPVSPAPGSMSQQLRMLIDAGLLILQGGTAIPAAAFAHAAITLYYLRIREETS